MTIDEIKQLNKGEEIFFAGAYYEFSELKEYPHGFMVGIYDEKPKNNHIDYISHEKVLKVYPCNRCQGGGCFDCAGFGKYPM